MPGAGIVVPTEINPELGRLLSVVPRPYYLYINNKGLKPVIVVI
jgi:hypothetical protein